MWDLATRINIDKNKSTHANGKRYVKIIYTTA